MKINSDGDFGKFMKISTGEANAEGPHLTVAVHMPLALPIPESAAASRLPTQIRSRVDEGKVKILAVADGQMTFEGDKPTKAQFLLMQGTLDDTDARPDYWLFDTQAKEFECAVLMDGDGRRYLNPKPLPEKEAVSRWMCGFLNAMLLGGVRYDLRYALVEDDLEQRCDGGR